MRFLSCALQALAPDIADNRDNNELRFLAARYLESRSGRITLRISRMCVSSTKVGCGAISGGECASELWTRRRKVVQMYISRIDRFMWIERLGGRPWLITPEQPEAFVRALLR